MVRRDSPERVTSASLDGLPDWACATGTDQTATDAIAKTANAREVRIIFFMVIISTMFFASPDLFYFG